MVLPEVMVMALQHIQEELHGPGRLRFIVQPLVAVALGIRDGRHDADAGREPYLFTVIFRAEHRRESLLSGLATLGKPLVVAILIDMIIQYIMFDFVRLWSAFLVGGLLMGVPYSVARGLSNRTTRRRRARRNG